MIDSLITPGALLMGKYRVEKVLGQGAMGVVVAATNVALRQRVALKFMLPGREPNPERDARFLREAQIAAQLTSQHIARVLDVGTMADSGTPYLVMEHLDGQDLDAVLAKRGQLPIPEAVSYVLQVCEAVAEAHNAGIVHRDLKPANLFLTRLADGSPCVKVLDFGVSKLTEPGAALTQEAVALGSPLYMSPEQMESSRGVDARSDVWALGIVLYQLVADKTPFHADGIQQVCVRVFQGKPTPLSTFRDDAPTGFEAALLRCFEKDREQRWQNVAEFAAALVPFGPARAIVHAERAAAILGLNDGPQRLTDLLPPAPVDVAPARALAASEGASGTLETVAKLLVASPPSGLRSRPILALGLGLAALTLGALASLGLALSRGRAPATPEPAPSAILTPAPSVSAAVSQPSSTPPPAASTVLEPATSAAPSATAVAAPPKGRAPYVAPPLHPTAPVKVNPVPPKKSVLDRG
jgi:eukaryotic-like serine/threonine-protein kinase